MSLLHPHIRALHALATSYQAHADACMEGAEDESNDPETRVGMVRTAISFEGHASVHREAAKMLENEAALQPPLAEEHAKHPITYNPKGKP